MERILVVGGAGYIGSTLCRRLLWEGYRVRALDCLLYGSAGVKDLLPNSGFELIHQDVRDIEAAARHLRDVAGVVYLGEVVGVATTLLGEEGAWQWNVLAPLAFAQAAADAKISRFVYASSCSVYERAEVPDNPVFVESSDLDPVSIYAKAKYAVEKELAKMRVPATILRFATVFGSSHRMRFDLAVNGMTKDAVVTGKINLQGAEKWRPFVHVHDVAEVISTVLSSEVDRVSGRTFNVGVSSNVMTLGDLGETIRTLVGPRVHLEYGGSGQDARSYRVGFDALGWLGCRPFRPVSFGVLELARGLREGQFGDCADPQYSNLRALRLWLEDGGR